MKAKKNLKKNKIFFFLFVSKMNEREKKINQAKRLAMMMMMRCSNTSKENKKKTKREKYTKISVYIAKLRVKKK